MRVRASTPPRERDDGCVFGTLKTLAVVLDAAVSAVTRLVSACGRVRQPDVDDEGGSLPTVFGDFGIYCGRRSTVDGLRTGLRRAVSPVPQCLLCGSGRGGALSLGSEMSLSSSSTARLDVQLELLLLTLATHNTLISYTNCSTTSLLLLLLVRCRRRPSVQLSVPGGDRGD